jgi:acetyl esterase/lipase
MRNLVAAALLAVCGSTSAAVAQIVPAAVVADPPVDKAYPADMQVAAILSHGSIMHGVLYIASGAGPHPALLLMHGFPGDEQNLDLAQSARRAGWNVLTFHYRGSWGSEGTFSFGHALEDGDSAISFLRDPANAKKYRIDSRRIVVAGHSMGGLMAAHSCANDRAVIGAVLISAWNIGGEVAAVKTDADRSQEIASFADSMESLVGCTPEGLFSEAVAHKSEWNFITYAEALASRPLLVVTSDDGNAPDSDALVAAMGKARGMAVTEVHFPADHPYSDHRIALQAAVVRWLETLEPAKP